MCSREPASLFRLININEQININDVGLSGRLRRLAGRVYIENEAKRAVFVVLGWVVECRYFKRLLLFLRIIGQLKQLLMV